jgi:predicted HicB family RNase H-like nuclease
VDVRFSGGDLELTYVEEEAPPGPPLSAEDMTARITLRLPEGLKGIVEAAAALEGMSANTWLVQTISRNASQHRRPGGRRLTGFGQS